MIYELFISIIRYSIATNTKILCFMQWIQQSLPFSRMAAAVPCLQRPSRTVYSSCLVGAVINHLTLWCQLPSDGGRCQLPSDGGRCQTYVTRLDSVQSVVKLTTLRPRVDTPRKLCAESAVNQATKTNITLVIRTSAYRNGPLIYIQTYCDLQQRAITVIISETRPRARQKRNVINVVNITRVPTVNERLR